MRALPVAFLLLGLLPTCAAAQKPAMQKMEHAVESWQFQKVGSVNLPIRGYARLPDEAWPKYGRRFS